VETDFTAATANETLEIAPGDSIEVSYVDEVRPAEQAPVHVAELNSSFYNGAVRIANEVVVERRGEMVSELDDASRFRQGDQLMVVVEEYDLDVSDAADEVQVSVRTSSGEETTIRAREIHQHQHARESDPYHSGVFHGVLKTGKQTEGDRIKVQPGDRITVAYMDRENTDPGIPIERTASVMEAGRGRPRLVVYRTGTEMVPDRSLEAKSRLRLLRLRGREVDEATILKRRVRALHPRAEAAAAHSSGGELRVSMQAPLLLQMVHPSRALNRGSVIEAEVVTERELRAAEEEGREPETVPVPMAIAPLGEHARRYGYHDLRIVSPIRRTEGELMRDGVFSGVVRLQIGSPGDPVNDLVLEASPEGIYGTNQRGGDLLLEEESEPLRVPTILVSGPETLYVRYRDPDLDDLVQEKVRLVSAGRLEILDDTYTVSKNAIHMGESFYLQVSDPDRDRSDEQDRITVAIRAAESGDRYGLTLTETMPHSGVFTGSVQPKLSEKARLARLAAARGQGGAEDAADKSGKEPGKADDPPTPATDGAEAAAAAGTDRPAAAAAQEDPEDGVFRVAFGDTVTFVYEDDMTLTGEAGVVEARGRVHHGADGTLVAFSKRFKDPEMAVKVRFLRAEAKLEMAKEYRKLKQEARSSELIAEGKRILTEALRDYPDTSLVAQGEYLLANLAQELGRDEEDDALRRQYYQEAIGKYSKIISTWPESDYAARSQFKMALCLEKMGDFDRASEEYVKLTYTYPAHELVTDATVRLGNYYYQAKQFKVAGKIFFNFQQRYPTHELAPRALFLGAQCHMKQAAEVAGDERLRSARNEQFQEALKALELLLTTYQDEKELRAESMYWMGDIHFKTGDYRASYIAFKKLTFDYPSTEWAKRARGYLTDEKFARIEE
jgi:outer membrane protein assembly factor BamD (BamD/ComL family)